MELLSEDIKINKLSKLLTSYSDSRGISFCFQEQQLYNEEVFAHFGCLSLFLVEAKQLYEKIYNGLYTTEELLDGIVKRPRNLTENQKEIEKKFINELPINKKFPIRLIEAEDGETYFNFYPLTDPSISSDFSIISHFSLFSLEEYVKLYTNNKTLMIDGNIPLDPLYTKMVEQVNLGKVFIQTKQSFNLNLAKD